MLGHREMTAEDYTGILRRRKWWIIVLAVVGPALAFAVSLFIPDQYTSQTLVLIEGQKVPEKWVASIVSDELNQRLGSMKEQILSRTRLQPLIERYELWKPDWDKIPMEDLVARLRGAVKVTPIQSVAKTSRTGDLPGFTIAVTLDSARRAQQVCSELTSLFIEENLRIRERRAVGTTEFLSKQLEEAKQKLDAQDARQASFKRQYISQMPGQEQTNMTLLMGATSQLEAVTQLLNRTQQDKAYMESLLAQQLQAWQATQSGTNPVTMDQQLAALQNQLATVENRYTPNHPDVVKLKNDIEQVKQKMAEAEKVQPSKDTQTAKAVEPPQIQQMRGQIHQATQTIREKTRDQERLQEQIKVYQARVQMSPVVEQEYKEVMRDYQTALDFYNSLLTKKTDSEMATKLEQDQQGEQFSVMDAANLPEKPTYPNRALFAGGGFGGGLGLGLAICLLLELLDKSLRLDRDVEVLLGLPALGVIPTVGEFKPVKRSFWKRNRPEMAPAARPHEA